MKNRIEKNGRTAARRQKKESAEILGNAENKELEKDNVGGESADILCAPSDVSASNKAEQRQAEKNETAENKETEKENVGGESAVILGAPSDVSASNKAEQRQAEKSGNAENKIAAREKRGRELIRFENVTKIYKMGEVKIEALGGVDFTIDEGEFTVVLGASGAGKSTILNILGGMDTATSGKVIVDGEDIAAYNSKKLTNFRRFKVGFVFQFYNLISNLNALENVEFAASVTHGHLDARSTLESVGLSERAKNFPSQLSGGEQQRVAIARAVAKNPMLLLCDEPTGALDYKTGKMVLKLLQQVNEQYKKTVVLITHNSYLAPMADKVIRVKSGKVENIILNEKKIPIEQIDW